MKTIQSVVNEMRDRFRDAGLETPELDSRLLVQSALGISHEELLLNNNRLINDIESKKLIEMTGQRLRHTPISRIMGIKLFWRSDFKVSRETLDPRPDSETLIEAAVKQFDKQKCFTVLDLGTGTGCLLLSLLQEFPQATGVGIDKSAGAVQVAEENAAALGLSERASFKTADWTKMEIGKPFDVVISNPPYIAESEIPGLAPEVKEYDPLLALVGGVDGLRCYREIAALLPKLLTKKGYAFLEIGATQAEAVKDILAGYGFSVLQVIQDLAGHNRCIVAKSGQDV